MVVCLTMLADAYSSRPGFSQSITKRDTVKYFRQLASTAKSYGLSTGLKNVPELLRDVSDVVQFAVNEGD
jgi:hypothetical protein